MNKLPVLINRLVLHVSRENSQNMTHEHKNEGNAIIHEGNKV